MRFPKRLTKCLTGQIDFGAFRVLEVVPHKVHGSVVFLLPKKTSAHAYYGMVVGEEGHWFSSAEHMLDEAKRCNYIGGIKRTVLLLRIRRINKKH